jgi:membrane-bound serine protease (ClpP class)
MKHGVLVVLLLLAMPASARQGDAAGDPLVVVAALRDAIINPVTARYIVRTIDEAERRQAAAVLIELDTPGGLVDSTRAITRRILDSRVPVVVYVFPPGGRAASAGLFITIAAHVAAMAPGTNIGAAHPVQAGGAPFPQQPAPSQPEQPGSKGDDKPAPASPMEDKVLNDTVAWARSLAELRGRNVDWVERAVRDSESLPASEAKARNVVDLIATDPRALLDEIHGRRVTMNSGSVELKVRHARTDAVEMWWGEEVLSLLAHPNVAFLLLIFGFYGILLELYTPGWGVGGTVGVICLILGFFAMAVLPINYVGLALLVIGLLLFVAEAFVVSHGVLALGGVACLSIGGLMLVDSTPGFIRVSPWLVLPVALATAAISMFLVSRAVGAYRLAPITGGEALLRESGIADGPFERQLDRYVGVVRTHGELWQATSLEAIADRQRVRIDNRQGLVLHVRPLGEAPETAGEVRS